MIFRSIVCRTNRLRLPFVTTLLVATVFIPAAVDSADGAEPTLKAVVLAGPDAGPNVGQYKSDGSYVLTGAGRDSSDCRHEGSFAYVETDASNFTFIARIANKPTGTADPQYGISVRAGLDGTEKCLNLRFDGREPHRCFRWLMRHHVTPSSHDGSGRAYLYGYEREMTAGENVWLKIVRRYPNVFGHYSTDGNNWRELGTDYLKVLLPQKVCVGPMVTAGGDGKRPVSVTYDDISFTIDPTDENTESAAVWKEYHPKVGTWRMHLAKVQVDERKDEFISPFLLMPKNMNPADIRAVLFTAGSKELVVDDKAFQWDKGEGTLRKPAAMKSWEGTLDIEGIRPFNQILAHYGIVRVGGYFPPQHYERAVERLAEMSRIKHLPNVPFVATGASFAGGYSAKAAAAFPEKTIAAAPVVIGMAGAKTDDRRVLDTPHLHVFGSRDGGHLKDAVATIPGLRTKRALWAAAPMWRVYHRQHKSNALIYPYFLEMIDLRVPDGADYRKGPVRLRQLSEASGWFGLTDTWETNFPQVVPVRRYKGNSKNLVWLPSEKTARLWQAFISENPKTIIHFPMFEGTSTYGGPQPHGWHNSFLAANEPFELVASGPLGDDLSVEYYAGLKQLDVLAGKDYRVRLEGLPPGLHSIYAITTARGQEEISRPVTIMFQERKP